MNIEMKVVKTVPFHMVESSKCFIPRFPNSTPDNRNLWIKLDTSRDSAVNLFNGELAVIHPDTVCRPVIAKVVVE